MHGKKRLAALALCLLAPAALASQLDYTPLNPSFGGNPMNGQYLLAKAQAENKTKDPDAVDYFNRDPVKAFQEDLQRQIFSRLARDIAAQVFGEGGEGGLSSGGVFVTGDYTVEVITSDPENVTLRITNTVTGAVTVITVPIFGAGGP